MDAVEKTCFKCGRTLPRTEFYRHPQMADGLLGKCKECTKTDSKARFVTKREEVRAYDKERTQRAERKAWRAAHPGDPEKKRVRSMTGAAIRDGRLVPRPCEVCGEVVVEAHHDDYSKPLEVRWLCFRHHREHHGQKVG